MVEVGDRVLCETPCSKPLSQGRYEIAMKKVRYMSKSDAVNVTGGMNPVSWKLDPDFGWLTVKSDPSGFDITVNGEEIGKTPLEACEMSPGSYEVLITNNRYHATGRRIIIERGEREVLEVAPVPRNGAVKVEAIDGEGNAVEGDVYVNGKKTGRTYETLTLLIGACEVEVRSPHGSWKGRADVREKKVATVKAEIKSLITGTSAAGFEMVLIQSGTFTMGSPSSEPSRYSDEKQHRVTLSKPFYLSATEVTQSRWKQVMGNNPSRFKGDNLPVEGVSWFDAVKFCNALSKREGLNPAYTISGISVSWNKSSDGYRLPTEAEWEYACHAGTTTPFNTGRCLSADEANYNGKRPLKGCPKGNYRAETVPVSSFDPNRWGLYDMHGNVCEWCWDWYKKYSGTVTDPSGPAEGGDRVVRGGSWFDGGRHVRSAIRIRGAPGIRSRSDDVGFRLARGH